jgi:uncharacterized protein YggE
MKVFLLFGAMLVSCAAGAQQIGQPQLAIGSANRTLSVSAMESVTADPDVAILHIGFETALQDAKAAYAEGAQTSNAIIGAVKQAGIAENAIHSEMQYLDRDPNPNNKQRKYKLTQRWTVKVPPERAAEILDVAVNAGATSSGEIEWNVKDEKALEQQALEKAATRARENAAVLAKGMGVKLGSLIYTSNELSGSVFRPRVMAMSAGVMAKQAEPLAIEPQKVSRQATVYAVFAIE